MSRDVTPVVAAQVLLRHGMADDVVAGYLARSWRLDDLDCHAALRVAHILLRRQQVHLTR